MEVQLTSDQEQQLVRLASDRGSTPVNVIQDILSSYLESESHFVAAVNLGDEALDRGDYLPHEEVAAKLQELFSS